MYLGCAGLELEEPATQGDGDRLGSIARAELQRDVLGVRLDRRLRNVKARGNVAVADPFSHQPEHFDPSHGSIFPMTMSQGCAPEFDMLDVLKAARQRLQ